MEEEGGRKILGIGGAGRVSRSLRNPSEIPLGMLKGFLHGILTRILEISSRNPLRNPDRNHRGISKVKNSAREGEVEEAEEDLWCWRGSACVEILWESLRNPRIPLGMLKGSPQRNPQKNPWEILEELSKDSRGIHSGIVEAIPLESFR